MLPSRLHCAVACSVAIATAPAVCVAQEKYPVKPIRVVTAAPGSNHDWGARLSAQELTNRIGQRVVVENRSSIAIEYVAKEAQPDGYTLLFYGATVWLQPFLNKVGWDPVADFAPITLAMSSPNVLVVHPSLPVNSVKELIALAKARPGDLNYSAGGGGSTPHIAAELFNHLAKTKIVRIHYKGSGPSMIGLLSGEAQLMFAALGPITPHVKANKVRALAVTTPKRTALMPDLPAVAETLPGYTAEATIGFFAPRKTPSALVAQLHREIVQGLKGVDPKVLHNAGIEIVGSTPEEFAAFIKAEMERMGPVIKAASFHN
jgi:tripartite-type tricarboxylate transporter receptor subunit TctC